MQTIAIAFTLKGQNFEDIKNVLTTLSGQLGGKSGNTILVHGFMSRQAVLDKGFSTDVVDTLADLFPYQLNCFVDGQPKRAEMAAILKAQKGTVYTIGEVKEGVAEEVDLYAAAGVNVSTLPINWNGNMIGRELTFGEKAVGITFNPGGMPQVNTIKRLSADLIDELASQRTSLSGNGECAAQYTLAIRKIQEGQMWGVKAATWQY